MDSLILFKVRCSNLNVNEHVALTGSTQNLGFWSTGSFILLKPTDTSRQVWVSDPIAFDINFAFEYKFYVCSIQEKKIFYWESIPFNGNRRYRPKFYKITLDHSLHDPVIRETISQRYFASVTYKKDSELSFEVQSVGSEGSGTLFKQLEHHLSLFSPISNSDNQYKSIYESLVNHGSLKDAKKLSSTSLFFTHDITYIKQDLEIPLVTKGEFIIFVTHYLPIVIKDTVGCELALEINMNDTKYFYFYLAENFKKTFEKVHWIGLFPLHSSLESQKNKITKLLWDRFQMIPVFIAQDEFRDYQKKYCDELYEFYLENGAKTLEQKRADNYSLHIKINKLLANEIFLILSKNSVVKFDKNVMIILNDYQTSLIPFYLYKQKVWNKLNISINLFTPFPNYEQFVNIPNSNKMMDSILLCDLISFNCYDNAKDFITCVKKIYDINYTCEKQGHQMISYLGRNIFIRVVKISIDQKKILESLMTPKFDRIKRELLPKIINKFLIVVVDEIKESSTVFDVLNILHNIFQNYPKIGEVAQVVYLVKNIVSYSQQKVETIIKFVKFLNSQYAIPKNAKNYVPPFVVYFEDCTFSERIIFMKQADLLINLQIFGRVNIEVYEFALNNEKNGKILINHSYEYHTAIQNLEEINSMMTKDLYLEISNAIIKIFENKCKPNQTLHSKQAKDRDTTTNSKDNLIKNDIWYWLESILIDFKKSVIDQKEATFIRYDNDVSVKCIGSHKIFHLKPAEIKIAIKKSSKRVLMFYFESVLENENISGIFEANLFIENIDEINPELDPILQQIKMSSIIKKISYLTTDPKNSVYIITSLPCIIIDRICSEIQNLWIFAEEGCYYKNTSSQNNQWIDVSKFDTSWKDKIKKIMSKFYIKIEGAKFIETANLVSVQMNSENSEYSELQAKELHSHLQKVCCGYSCLTLFLDNKTVTVKFNEIPKTLIIEMILTYEFLKKGKLDFILGLFNQHNEELFVAMKKYINKNPKNFNLESLSYFPTKIGHAITHAKYYLSEDEVEGILESLVVSPDKNL